MAKESKFVQLFISFPNKKEAKNVSMLLLKEKLAACIQIVPIESMYRWKGKIERAKEYLCLIKTKAEKVRDIVREVKKLHSYSIPEIISVSLSDGNPDYFNWLKEEV